MASPKIWRVCCPLLSFGLKTAFRVKCKKLPWVPNFTCSRRNVSILFSASTSTRFSVSTVHLHLDLSSLLGPLLVLYLFCHSFYQNCHIYLLRCVLPSATPDILWCPDGFILHINRQIIVAITFLYRMRTMCYESGACSQGICSLSVCPHVNEVVVKRFGRFSWCSVWRYRARTTNVAFT